MNENEGHKFGVYATVGTCAVLCSALGVGSFTLADYFNGLHLQQYEDVLEDSQTPGNSKTAGTFNSQLSNIIIDQSKISRLDEKSEYAYQNGDIELYETLLSESQKKEDSLEKAYNDFVVNMLTNENLSETDFKRFVGTIEDNNLPHKKWPFYLDSDNAEYLNACRFNVTQGVAPLTADRNKARRVAECMDSKEQEYAYAKDFGRNNSFAAVVISPVIAVLVFAMFEFKGTPLNEAMYRGYKNLYRRRKFGSVSRN